MNPEVGGGGGEGVDGVEVVGSDADGDGGGVAGLEGLALAGVCGLVVETSNARRLAVSSGIHARRGR